MRRPSSTTYDTIFSEIIQKFNKYYEVNKFYPSKIVLGKFQWLVISAELDRKYDMNTYDKISLEWYIYNNLIYLCKTIGYRSIIECRA